MVQSSLKLNKQLYEFSRLRSNSNNQYGKKIKSHCEERSNHIMRATNRIASFLAMTKWDFFFNKISITFRYNFSIKFHCVFNFQSLIFWFRSFKHIELFHLFQFVFFPREIRKNIHNRRF